MGRNDFGMAVTDSFVYLAGGMSDLDIGTTASVIRALGVGWNGAGVQLLMAMRSGSKVKSSILNSTLRAALPPRVRSSP